MSDATPAEGTLLYYLAQVPDWRGRRGRSYSLASLLALAATAMLCGARSLCAIAQWGRDYNHLAPLLGLTKPHPKLPDRYRTPCVGQLHAIFAALDAAAFEAALTAWVVAGGLDPEGLEWHVDGRCLRGSRSGARPGTHLVAAFAGGHGAAVARLATADTNEHKAALELLKLVPLAGAVVTADAAFTPRDLCAAVLEAGGDYLLPVKGNQPTLRQDIADEFAGCFPPGGGHRAGGGRRLGGPLEQGPRAGGAAAAAGLVAAQ